MHTTADERRARATLYSLEKVIFVQIARRRRFKNIQFGVPSAVCVACTSGRHVAHADWCPQVSFRVPKDPDAREAQGLPQDTTHGEKNRRLEKKEMKGAEKAVLERRVVEDAVLQARNARLGLGAALQLAQVPSPCLSSRDARVSSAKSAGSYRTLAEYSGWWA